MPRSSTQTRQSVLEAAYQLFRQKGFVRVGVDEIAAAAGVTKRTLYHHFSSKDALLAAVLASQHERMFAAFQNFGEMKPGTPAQIVETLFDKLDRWSAKPRWTGSGFTRLAIELADLPKHPARAIAREHKVVLEAYIAGLLADADASSPRKRAREIWLLAEGAMALILIHGDRSYAGAAAQAAKKLVSGAPRRKPHSSRI